MWLAIINRYASKSSSRVLQYRKLLQTTKKNGLSVDSYLLKMKNLANNLIATGAKVSKQDLVQYVLRGLDLDFQPTFTILNISPKQYSLNEVQDHLLAYEFRLEEAHNVIAHDLTHKVAYLVSGTCTEFGHGNIVNSIESTNQKSYAYNANNMDFNA